MKDKELRVFGVKLNEVKAISCAGCAFEEGKGPLERWRCQDLVHAGKLPSCFAMERWDCTSVKYVIDHEDTIPATLSILDDTNLLPYLTCKIEVGELMEWLEEDLRDEVEKHPELEGCLFNFVSKEEFISYLENRFGACNLINNEVTKNFLRLK